MLDVEKLDPKYEVIRRLREGGMGTIYLVRHRLLEELRVIKVLRAQMSSDSDLDERFAREAKTAIQLRHPNIAQLYDFSIDPTGVAYIVMEYIEGVNLDEYCRARPSIDLPETLGIAIQALRALGFLHRKGYVHRDISPDNLMLTRDADGHSLVKLIDLGIVKILREDSQATATVHYLGKPRFSSPEQLASSTVDARSDLYSFGVMLYELVTGRHPISGQDLPSIVTGHLYLPPLSFETSDPDRKIPESLRSLILEALAKEPEGRPQSAEAFGRRLTEIQRELARAAAAANARPSAADIDRLLVEVEKALGAQRFPQALASLEEVLRLSPGDARALALRELVHAAITRQAPDDEDTQPFRNLSAHEAGGSAVVDQRTLIQQARGVVPPPPVTSDGQRRRRTIKVSMLGLAVLGIGALLAVAIARLRSGGQSVPADYTHGLSALARQEPGEAIPLLRSAAGHDPIEHDGYLPFFELGVALAASGDCEAAEVAFTTSLGQGAVTRSAEAVAQMASARAECTKTGLEPELVAFETQVTALEAQVKALEGDRSNRDLAQLWRDPAIGRELDRVASLLRDARTLTDSARKKGSRDPLFAAQDRFADAQLALGALLKKIAAL
ncbi:MAG: protein kinase [Thermoanaerobaculia bacterium]